MRYHFNVIIPLWLILNVLVGQWGTILAANRHRSNGLSGVDGGAVDIDSQGPEWIKNSAGNPLAEDITTTVVVVGCKNVPWSSPMEKEMVMFASRHVSDQTLLFDLHAGPTIALKPQHALTSEMRWNEGEGFTNGRGDRWDKWSIKCPAVGGDAAPRTCNLPPHDHVIVYLYVFKYSDASLMGSEAFERIIVVVEGEQPEITHWQKNVPRSIECHKELSRITRFAQSSRSKQLFHARNVCGGRLDVINSAVWSPASCPNQGIYLLGWTATNEFQIYSSKYSTVSVRDDVFPTINNTATRTICIVDEKHQAGAPNAPKLCPARLVDYYARTVLARDNCDDWDELDITVAKRDRIICDGKGAGDATTKPVNGGDAGFECRPVDDTIKGNDDKLLSFPYHPYYEKCTPLPDASLTRYLLKIGDICANYHPTQIDVTVHFVGSSSVCPASSFAVDSSIKHLQYDGK